MSGRPGGTNGRGAAATCLSADAGEFRAALERFVAAGIDLLDAMDAPMADREPDGEDEVVSEDDGVVRNLAQVGRQWGSAT